MMGCGIVRIINGEPFYCMSETCGGTLHYMRKLDANETRAGTQITISDPAMRMPLPHPA